MKKTIEEKRWVISMDKDFAALGYYGELYLVDHILDAYFFIKKEYAKKKAAEVPNSKVIEVIESVTYNEKRK